MQAERFHAVIFEGVVESTVAMLREVIERGIECEEVRPDATGSCVFGIIPAMMTCRSEVCGSEWPDMDVEEAIDWLVTLLLRPSGS